MSKTGQAVAIEFEIGDAVDREIVGHGLKGRDRDGIAEDIPRPGHGCGRSYAYLIRHEVNVAALTRTKHQTVRSQPHRLGIAIGCSVFNSEGDQGGLPTKAFLQPVCEEVLT